MSVADHLALVRHRIRDACRRSGRDPNAVTLVGVTKTVPLDLVRDAVAAGLSDVGESRVQEAQEKFPRLPDVRRHLVGHLQRNKAKVAAGLFDVVQSVDALDVAQDLSRHAAGRPEPLDVLLQVNVSGEATKFGCRPEQAPELARNLLQLPHLHFSGLMTIAPLSPDPESARMAFRMLRLLREELQQALARPLVLSMGMSGDFEIAIEEGTDLVRIGTAIFGQRMR